jgi:hypothetical protein
MLKHWKKLTLGGHACARNKAGGGRLAADRHFRRTPGGSRPLGPVAAAHGVGQSNLPSDGCVALDLIQTRSRLEWKQDLTHRGPRAHLVGLARFLALLRGKAAAEGDQGRGLEVPQQRSRIEVWRRVKAKTLSSSMLRSDRSRRVLHRRNRYAEGALRVPARCPGADWNWR